MSEHILMKCYLNKKQKKPNLLVKLEADDYGSGWTGEIEREIINTLYTHTQHGFGRVEVITEL